MEEKFLLELFDRFNSSDAAELKISADGYTFELRRKEACIAGSPAVPASAPPPVYNAAADKKPEPDSKPAKNAAPAASDTIIIKSPVVGTFYRSPNPDAPAFAETGKKVLKGQKLCIIEAMKMMNALEAEFDCEIVDVLANNGDLVEFDQPLFEVRHV
ncbi:acetyl-CoA carboxylase biotin carboxyl carrier protein [Brucepastera parasyntrophica]|uniref:acetyl-CoA carboxylase biotin carboxyl carrier protein n=1 Tax=Brucepastera parasyntrophica TaxID=2880008 RepID=UPI00210BAA7D|nr:acetyl-CoA carboxylase biotin carboxyl carrier protein [Brucepastera parasyntrophica]ULQ60790.1 acetyl-CoA carboxylase biotin carboxyl carrier protein [Brucepastera parasyntrophica]